MSNNNISFILHKPQLSENIGACARAMKNFDFRNMIVVDPKPIFPNDKILATSVGAKDVINKSKTFKDLNLADVAITISIFLRADFKSLKVLLLSITSLAPTEVAKILSFGKIGLGSTTIIF